MLEHPKLLKWGSRIHNDVRWIRDDFGVETASTNDLFHFCRERDAVPPGKVVGLDVLYARIAGLYLPKNQDIRCGDWSADVLTQDQQDYAALDAYASLDIYTRVKDKREYGQLIELGFDTPGQLVHYRHKHNSTSPVLTGYLLETPEAGSQVDLVLPPSSADASATTVKRKVLHHQRLVAVQRVDKPAWKPPGYPHSLHFASAPVAEPLTMLLNVGHLYTRPPMREANELPPAETSMPQMEPEQHEPMSEDRLLAIREQLEKEAEAIFDDDVAEGGNEAQSLGELGGLPRTANSGGWLEGGGGECKAACSGNMY